MSSARDAGALVRQYAFLDDCPPSVLDAVITLPVGTLAERVAGMRQWHDSLLKGELPGPSTWPSAQIAAPIRDALTSMNLARFCKAQPDLVDALLKDIVAAIGQQHVSFQSEVAKKLAELEALERDRAHQQELAMAERELRKAREIRLSEADLASIRALADQHMAEWQPGPDRELVDTWQERARAWAQIADVFGDLGMMLGRGWDLAQGVLKQTGWLDVMRLRELIEKLPQLRAIVQALGRLHRANNEESVAEKVFAPVRRLEQERQEVRTPLVPAETRGLRRSGDIARMLPSEAVMLGHPKLKMLWHARRAEDALLTYHVEGTEIEVRQVERDVLEEREGRAPRPERGPILAVIDTSGSMHGVPEQVAKAVVLEALRVAHSERRRCYVYSYSGPGNVLEHELDLSPAGIGRLLRFLAHTFGGGTDIGALSLVTERLKQHDWKKADVILVSDGEWAAPAAIVQAVAAARAQGTCFHGVQIGARGRTGMHTICDPVHEFSEWQALGR